MTPTDVDGWLEVAAEGGAVDIEGDIIRRRRT
jgi:hypothetical protein